MRCSANTTNLINQKLITFDYPKELLGIKLDNFFKFLQAVLKQTAREEDLAALESAGVCDKVFK